MTPTPLYQTLCAGLLYGLNCEVLGIDDKIWSPVELASVQTRSFYECCNFVLNHKEFDTAKDPAPAEISMIHFENIKPILHDLSDLDNDQLSEIGNIINGGGARREFNIDDAKSWLNGTMKTVMSYDQCLQVNAYLHSIHANVFNLPPDQFIPVDNNFNPYK